MLGIYQYTATPRLENGTLKKSMFHINKRTRAFYEYLNCCKYMHYASIKYEYFSSAFIGLI